MKTRTTIISLVVLATLLLQVSPAAGQTSFTTQPSTEVRSAYVTETLVWEVAGPGGWSYAIFLTTATMNQQEVAAAAVHVGPIEYELVSVPPGNYSFAVRVSLDNTIWSNITIQVAGSSSTSSSEASSTETGGLSTSFLWFSVPVALIIIRRQR